MEISQWCGATVAIAKKTYSPGRDREERSRQDRGGYVNPPETWEFNEIGLNLAPFRPILLSSPLVDVLCRLPPASKHSASSGRTGLDRANEGFSTQIARAVPPP